MKRAPVLRFPSPEIRSFAVDPKTKELVIRLHLGDSVPHHLADTLNALTDLVGQLRRTQEFCERQAQTDDRIEAQRRRHLDVARAYARLRACGMKHRESIRALFIDPAFSDLQASTAELNYWVKVYGSPSPVVRLRAGARPKRSNPRSES